MNVTPLRPIPANIDPPLRAALEQMRENLETGDGVRGEPLRRRITLGDLVSLGMVDVVGRLVGTQLTGPLDPNAIVPSGGGKPNLATPPRPENLVATAGFSKILLEWDEPAYSNHGLTEVYRAPTDNLSDAVPIGTSTFTLYADSVEPGETWFYWIRFVSDTDVAGPYNDDAGTEATTGEDPAAMLAALEGVITASQLHADLTSRINLIDGSEALAGSVAARIKQESTERLTADESFTQQLLQLSSAIAGNAAAITQESTARSNGDSATASQINQLSTTVDDHTASIEQQTQSIDGISAQWTIKANVNGRVSGVGLMDDGTTSIFEILANHFAVLDPLNPSKVILGTYKGAAIIDGAYIKTATISSAAIGSLSVDKLIGDTASFVIANIGNATIGSAQLANSIQSTNYSSNAGWKIYKSGAAYLNQVTVRGTVKASVIESSVFKTDSMRFDTGGGRTAPNSFSLEAGYDGGGSTSLTLYYGYIYHPNYGSGYRSTRLSAWNTPIRTSTVLHGDLGTVTAKLQIQYDNAGSWEDVKTITGYLDYNGGMCLAFSSSAGRSSYSFFSLRWRITGSTTRYFSSQLLVVNGA